MNDSQSTNWALLMTRDLWNFCSLQLNFRFRFPILIFQAQLISAQQIEQFWCLENYELFVSADKQLADPLFSSHSVFRNECPFINDLCTTCSGHFFPICMMIFHKTEVLTVILRWLTGLNLDWFKSYGLRCSRRLRASSANSKKKATDK